MMANNKVLASQEFMESFNKQVKEIQLCLAEGSGSSETEQPIKLKELKTLITNAMSKITTAAVYLPLYDQNNYINTLKDFTKKMEELQGEKRSKFTFSKKPSIKKVTAAATTADPSAPPVETSSAFQYGGAATGTEAVAAGKEGEQVVKIMTKGQTILLDEKTPSNLILSNLEDCTVKFAKGALVHEISTLFIQNVKNCIIGPLHVTASCMIQHIQDSKLALSCRQLRCHDSLKNDLWILVGSAPIIEDCGEMRFKPLPKEDSVVSQAASESESGLTEQQQESQPTLNLWREVLDFNWQKQTQSPNFSCLEEGSDELFNKYYVK